MIELLGSLLDPLVTVLGTGLRLFHGWGAPWWLSIVMLTVVVRTILFPLTVRQVRSIRRMQELKPDLDEVREKHRDDPKEQQRAMIELFAERKVNPLGGCLPLVVQMPVFLGLFYTIKEFENLRALRAVGYCGSRT